MTLFQFLTLVFFFENFAVYATKFFTIY